MRANSAWMCSVNRIRLSDGTNLTGSVSWPPRHGQEVSELFQWWFLLLCGIYCRYSELNRHCNSLPSFTDTNGFSLLKHDNDTELIFSCGPSQTPTNLVYVANSGCCSVELCANDCIYYTVLYCTTQNKAVLSDMINWLRSCCYTTYCGRDG